MKKKALMLACCLAFSNAYAATNTVNQETFASTKKILQLPNGTNIAYTETGNPSGKPVLLIHGFTDNARSWSLMTPYLNQDYRIISMDLRGHGKSSAPECCYALQDLGYDVKLLLDKLGIQKAALVGHSLGSIVTQVVAERYPEKVSEIVLVSTTSGTSRTSGQDSWLATEIAKLKQPIDPDSQFMLEWYANPTEVNNDFLTRERRESANVPVNVWRSILAEMQVNEFGRNLKKIKAPALIIHGEKDPLFGKQDQEQLKTDLQAAKFIDYPNAAHNVMWEVPREVAENINSFLSSK